MSCLWFLISSLWPSLLTQELLKPLELSRSIFCSKDMNLGGLLDGELVIRKTKPWLEAWNFQPHLGREKEQQKEFPTDHTYVMKPPQKALKYRVLRASRLVTHPCARMMVYPTSTRTEAPECSASFRPRPMYLFIWLFICILCRILYNELVNTNVFLNSVSHFSILSNLNRRPWEPQLIASWSEVQVTVWD